MSLSRIFLMTKKDIVLTTREKFFLAMIIFPIISTFIVNAALGSTGASNPSLALYAGDNLKSALMERSTLDIEYFDDPSALYDAVSKGEYDGGLIVGEYTKLYMSGNSLLNERVAIQSTVSSALSEISGKSKALIVESVILGEEEYSLKVRIIPFLLIFSVVIAGFIISSSLVEEREKKTINALLVSPASPLEVIISKSIYGLFLGIVLSAIVLIMNNALSEPLILFFLFLGTVFTVGIGLLGGAVMDNITDLIARMKIFNIFLQFPALVILFPQIPQWIGKFFPTYYFIDPVLRLSQGSAGFGDVWMHALVLLGCDIIVIMLASRVLRQRILGRNLFI